MRWLAGLFWRFAQNTQNSPDAVENGITQNGFQLLAVRLSPRPQALLELLLFLGPHPAETFEQIKMNFAVTQLAGGPAQFVQELECLSLFWVDVGMKHVTPSLKSSQAGAIEMCTFGRWLLAQIR